MEGREGRREEWRFEDWTGSGRRRELGEEGGREGGAETEKRKRRRKRRRRRRREERGRQVVVEIVREYLSADGGLCVDVGVRNRLAAGQWAGRLGGVHVIPFL